MPSTFEPSAGGPQPDQVAQAAGQSRLIHANGRHQRPKPAARRPRGLAPTLTPQPDQGTIRRFSSACYTALVSLAASLITLNQIRRFCKAL